MRTLVVEDEFTSRILLQKIFTAYGTCDIAVDGQEAVLAFRQALEEKYPYDLVCMDIMMPNKDGRIALQEIRDLEAEYGRTGTKEVRVIMTTALDDVKTVMGSYREGATSYITKPIEKAKLLEEVRALGLIE